MLPRRMPPLRGMGGVGFKAIGLAPLVCALMAAYPDAARAQDGLQLKPQSELIDRTGESPTETPGFGSADRMTGRPDSDLLLEGNAEFRRNGMVVTADTIKYLYVDNEVMADGSVRIVDNGDVFTGPSLRLRLDDHQGYFLEPEYTFAASQGRGNAERINFLGKNRAELINPVYTTCTADNLDWYLEADKIEIDREEQVGVGRGARLYFKGVPILAAPYISFPLNDERKSGFLSPTLGTTSNSGFEVMVPYYWNIAPNRDLTIYPKILSRRGLQLGAAFRYLEPTYRGEARYEVLPDDRITGDTRYALFTEHYWQRPDGWSGWWEVNKVSDDKYFVDFSRTVASSSQRTLPRRGVLTYSADYWSVTGRVQRYQTLQDRLSPLVPPYEKLPQLVLRAQRYDYGGFDFEVMADYTRFWHPTMVRGDRFIVQPSVAYPILRPGWYVTPRLSYSSTRYDLERTTPGMPDRLTRDLPTVSLDAGMTFERDATLFGKSYRQTLEPRIFYVRTPFRDQSNFPVFDSGITDFNFVQIFSENPYGGYDRVVDANQLTAAFTSRFIDQKDGAELFRATIGQRFYFDSQQVTLPGSAPIDGDKSDFLAAASGRIYPGVYVNAAVQYSPAVSGVVRSSFGGRWQPEPNKVINAQFRHVRDEINQIDLSGQWPLGGGWHGVGRINYSTRDKRFIESLAGVEYNGCCWVLRVVAQRFATGTREATTSLFIQLELNGLGRIGSNPLDALRRNIPGYQPVKPSIPSAAPFQYYE